MTFAITCIGLIPIMWATGTGSDVMKRIAAPMIGGIFTSFVLELLVYPEIYQVWRRGSLPRRAELETVEDDRREASHPSVTPLLNWQESRETAK